jgi:glycosyltransferase involved in cell wall biosynthesis
MSPKLEATADTTESTTERSESSVNDEQTQSTVEPIGRPASLPLRVCFVAGILGRGGAERQLLYTIDQLRGASVDVRVLCLTKGEAMEAELEALGVPAVWVGRSGSRYSRFREILRALKADPPCIVQSAHFYTNMYVGMAGAALGLPSIGAIRSELTGEFKANRPFGRAHLMMPRYLIANSRLGRDRAIEAGRHPARVFFVPNAVDMGRFRAERRASEERESEPLRLLFVGRLAAVKRPDMFLRLLSNLRTRFPDVRTEARLVGSGPDKPGLQIMAGQMGLDPQEVRFEDEATDTAPFFHWADLLVLTSRYEGSPNAILEAMTAGVPVVATAVGGVPDLLAHGGGLLVRPDDEGGLLGAVVRLHADRGLRDSLVREGLRYVEANHSPEDLKQRLLSIYETILGG